MLPIEIENLRERISQEITGSGAELVDISFRRVGSRGVLTVLVDKEGGIGLDVCAEINRKLGLLFDDTAAFNGPYFLEVNSPGLDRPIKTEKDFRRVLGQRLRVTWKDPSGRVFTNVGELKAVEEAGISFRKLEDDSATTLPLDRILKAVREIQFSAGGGSAKNFGGK